MTRRYSALLVFLASLLFATGCVERRYVITTDPPGAIVLRNGQPIGATPVDDHFLYYGKYHFTVIKEGYETLQVDQDIKPPWYEIFPIEIFSEIFTPYQTIDRREFHYQLEPRKILNPDQLIRDAQNLRNRGQTIGAEAPSQPPPAAPPPATPSTS